MILEIATGVPGDPQCRAIAFRSLHTICNDPVKAREGLSIRGDVITEFSEALRTLEKLYGMRPALQPAHAVRAWPLSRIETILTHMLERVYAVFAHEHALFRSRPKDVAELERVTQQRDRLDSLCHIMGCIVHLEDACDRLKQRKNVSTLPLHQPRYIEIRRAA
ncbi:MAG: hypothetical protein WC787_03505 [Patescibacteria group bacterium]